MQKKNVQKRQIVVLHQTSCFLLLAVFMLSKANHRMALALQIE